MEVQSCHRAINPSAWLSVHISKKKKAGDNLLLLSFQCFTHQHYQALFNVWIESRITQVVLKLIRIFVGFLPHFPQFWAQDVHMFKHFLGVFYENPNSINQQIKATRVRKKQQQRQPEKEYSTKKHEAYTKMVGAGKAVCCPKEHTNAKFPCLVFSLQGDFPNFSNVKQL